MYTPISQRKNTVIPTSNYIPIAQRKQESNSPTFSLSTPDFSVAKSTPAFIEKTPNPVFDFAKGVGTSIARNIASVGITISSKINPEIESFKPEDIKSLFGQSLFETVFGNEEIKSVETRIAEAEPKIAKWQKDLDILLETPGLNPVEKTVLKTLANLKPKELSFVGIMGSVGLDLTPFGGLEKNVYKALVKEVSEIGAEQLLKKMGVADDLAKNFALDVVKVSTEKEAKALFNNIAKLQQETKYAPKAYRPVPQRSGTDLKIVKETPESIVNFNLVDEVVPGKGKGTILKIGSDTNREGVNKYPTIHEGGKIKMVEGERIKIIDGVDTFLHKGDGGWIVSEESTGRFISESTSKEGAVAKARFNIDEVGKEKFIELIEKNKLPSEIKNQAVEKTAKELPIPDGLPKIPKQTQQSPRQIRIVQDIKENIIDSSSPRVTQTRTQSSILKSKLKLEQTASRKGAQAGRKIGKAEAENIATTNTEKAVRKEQLKTLKGGIEIRAKKDAIINVLKSTTESIERVKKMIVDHVKDALDPSDRGKALTLLRDAKTRKDMIKAFSRINRWAEDSIKKDLRNEILKTQRQIMDSPSVAIDYKARIKELMGDFELKGHRDSTLERLKKIQDFLRKEEAKGNDIEIPKRILNSLELLNRTPFDEITINQLTGLKAEMELLETLGRTKQRTIENIWEIQKEKILEEVASQGSKPIQNIELIKPEIGERLTLTQKFKNLIWSIGNQAARIDKVISPMDTIFDLLDGGKATYDGANFRFFKGRVDAGYGRYITRRDALQAQVVNLATKHGLDDSNFERMGVVAAREQEGGVDKLLSSGFTKEQVESVKLTANEQEVLDLMRATFDSQFPEIQDVMRRVYNKPVEKVKNYFSFMTDWKAMDESEVFERFGSQTPEQFGAPKKNVEAGFAISRVGGDQKIKINALDVFLQHTDNTSYLLELGETSKMLGEVASSDRYAELVGEVGQLMVREWIDVIARKGGAAGAQEIAVLNTLRKNVGIGILGLKLSTIAIQPTALIDGMGFIGTKYGMRGVTNFTTSPEWRKFIGNMPEISDRLGGEFALRELTEDTLLQEIQRKGFIPMQKLDQMTAGMIATGAYERKMIELGRAIDFSKYDPEALAYAQLAVRRTQSSGAFKDVPLAVSRGALTGNRSLDRAILQFQNFLLTRWSRIRHDAVRAGINTKDPKKAIPIFTAIIMSAIAASGIRLGVNKIQDFITGREDEDSVQDDMTKSFMYEMTGNIPFVGTAVSMAMYDGEMFPILDAPKGIISGLNRVITSKSEGAKLRGFTEFAGSTGAIFGIPGSAQTEQLVRGFLQDEKKEPEPKKLKTPTGLPELPSSKKILPTPPGLPKLPQL